MTDDGQTYAQLKEQAKALGIPFVGVNRAALAEAIAAHGNQGGTQAPADDPGSDESEEAGSPPPKSSRSRGPRLEVVRADSHTWWCPVCDNSQLHSERSCPKCGYVRA